MKIALIGNPNSGKTTMYNALTGRNERVGNWAGVTVEKKQSHIKRKFYNGVDKLIAVDLPGAYSMSPFTNEESVTSDYIKNENPDVIINIVDATNLSRSLFFTTQLLELGIPLVVALNKSDINEKKETEINVAKLQELLGCKVLETVSTSNKGLRKIIEAAVMLKGRKQNPLYIQKNIDYSSKSAVEKADRERFAYVNGIVGQVETRKILTKNKNYQDKIDDVLTNRWLGIPIFAVIMFLVFQISQAWVGPYFAEILAGLLGVFQNYVAGLLQNATPILSALLVDGVIGGVIAVVEFLPLVMVMYFLIALLEDCGYMARVSVVLDPIFKKVGLTGKSVIPFVIGVGCAVPGIMACRTIKNERERRATAMLTPFMPCGAKLPVISLFAGAFFKNTAWVGTLMYFLGIFIILISAVLINIITGNKARKSFFIIELPDYKAPSIKRAAFSMVSRGWAFIVKALTVILICNTVVQITQTFNWSFQVSNSANESILATIAMPFAYILVPVVGVLSWELAAAAITGFIAKENVVGTLAVCFVGLENLINAEELSLIEGAGLEAAGIMAITKVAALAYLMFNLFTPPCFAAISAMSSELKSKKWLLGAILFQLGVGFMVSFLVYQIGTLITTGSVGTGFVYGLAAVVAMAAILWLMAAKNKQPKKV